MPYGGNGGYSGVMTTLYLDSDADDAYEAASEPVLDWAHKVFGWLRERPVDRRASAHMFSNGLCAVLGVAGGEELLILWEFDGDDVVIRYLGPNTLL